MARHNKCFMFSESPQEVLDSDFAEKDADPVASSILVALPNPSELLSHVMDNLASGKWCCSVAGPNFHVTNSAIQVHLKHKGRFYVTRVSEEGNRINKEKYSGTFNKQGAVEFCFGDDVIASWTRAKEVAGWSF